jgi:hypothetical protein
VIKLFSVEAATRLLPVVESHVEALQRAARDTAALRTAATEMRPDSVEARNLIQEVGFLVGVAHDAKAELDRIGVQVTDLAEGHVAFPAQLGGEMVCLTWRRGERAITRYRRLSALGDDATPEQPLSPLGGDATAT